MKFKCDKTAQPSLFAFSFRDLVDQDSDVWLYIELFEGLDLSNFEKVYAGEGQVPIDPVLILRTMFYGLTHRVVSNRELTRSCRYDNRYIVLSGNTRPDRRTIDRFLIRHRKNISKLFVQIVDIAKEMNMVKLGKIAIDGSRFKGNTKVDGMKYGKMDTAILQLEEELKKLHQSTEEDVDDHDDDLPTNLKKKEDRLKKIREAKKKIEEEYAKREQKSNNRKIENITRSLNDPDALAMSYKNQKKAFIYGYNTQIAVDSENQIIVSSMVHDKAQDYQALPLLVDKIKELYGKFPEDILADLGYKSIGNIVTLSAKEINAYIATGSNEYQMVDEDIHALEQISYNKDKNHYTCMKGKVFSYNYKKERGGRIELRKAPLFCNDCNLCKKCKLFEKKTISVPAGDKLKIMQKYYEQSRTEEFSEVYRRRKVIVEPVFGNIKNKGMKILVNGREKVENWFNMACIAHNIEKIVGRRRALNRPLKEFIKKGNEFFDYFLSLWSIRENFLVIL